MALTASVDVAATGGTFTRLLTSASANPFQGSLLSLDSAGYAHELVAGEPFAGVARTGIVTRDMGAAAGDVAVEAIAGTFFGIIALTVTQADVGRRVYATDDGTYSLTQAAASTLLGRVHAVLGTTQAIVAFSTHEIQPFVVQYSLPAAGAALTNSTTRTALASVTIKAGTLKVGSRIRVRATAIATATNSTDTLLLDIGGAVGGTPAAIASATATDVANDNIAGFDLDLVVRTIGQSGTLAGGGLFTRTPAAGTGTAVAPVGLVASTTIDTTADLVLGLYGTWSVASASNSCRADHFTVDVIR
jgi:hypothetical protein